MIAILGICGKLSCGEEKFHGDKRMMLIGHTRPEDHQTQPQADKVRADKTLRNRTDDAKAIGARIMTHSLAVPLLNPAQEDQVFLSPARTNCHHNKD